MLPILTSSKQLALSSAYIEFIRASNFMKIGITITTVNWQYIA